MKEVTLVLGDFEGEVFGDVVGVDYGAYVCFENDIPMIFAIGDFDSVTPQQYEALLKSGVALTKLPSMKNDTDFYAAYKLCNDYDRIVVVGGLGRRRDHEYTNIVIALQDSRIEFVDAQNRIKKYDAGHHIISKEGYKYLSFIVFAPITITLEGVKYPLHERRVTFGETYLTSNEILEKQANVIIEENPVLVIQSNDKRA